MKKMRIVLSILAIVFAFGGTFATQYHSGSLITAYEYIPETEEDPAQCFVTTTDCGLVGEIVCTVNNHEIRENSDDQTQCGETLKRPE